MNVVLIGYRGCGKTAVGLQLAARLGVPFVDTDAQIVQREGMTIREIFARKGESGFRRIEHDVITECVHRPSACVLSVGGGAIELNDNAALLRSFGRVVWLTAPPKTLWNRIQADPNTDQDRPNLGSGGLDEVRSILARRLPRYNDLAQIIVDTHGRSIDQVVDDVIARLSMRSPDAP